MKPIILITSYHVGKEELEGKNVRGAKGQDMTMCTWDYINAIQLAGGVPIVAPNIQDEEAMDQMISIADGILFSGGEDVNPCHYGEEVQTDNLKVVVQRDSFELKLAEKLLTMKKPLFGICRGMQLLNVAGGGTLYQDIDTQFPTEIRHSYPGRYKWDLIHDVRIESNTRLMEAYLSEVNTVNSFHHQAVLKLSPLFKPTAYSTDGIVEAYEAEGNQFIVGVQWHPEMMFEKYTKELVLFKHFVHAAK